ncbi:hypothetical protein [Tepidibacillus marianensis]|uniref:hypothetical protein n=1 Tax=Tepidibacillus marianensis TaxID=3131995 RepID=UPI0030CA5C93
MKKFSLVLLSLFLLVSIVFTGCGKEKAPKDLILDSVKKSAEIKSSAFDGKIDITLDTKNLKGTQEELATLQMFNQMQIRLSGKQNVNPLQFEGNLQAQMGGLSIDLPIIMKDNMLYVKIPAIAQPYIQDTTKQYISMDATEFSKNTDPMKNSEESLKLVTSILNSLDEKAFVKEDVKNFALTDGTEANAVSVVITKDNLKPFLQKFMVESLPLIMDQAQKSAVTDENKKQLQQAKNDLTKNKAEIDKTINEIDKYLTINTFKTTSVYDKEGFERKTVMTFDGIVNLDKEGSLGLKMNVEVNTKDINKEQKFEMTVPTKDQTIDLQQLEKTQPYYLNNGN